MAKWVLCVMHRRPTPSCSRRPPADGVRPRARAARWRRGDRQRSNAIWLTAGAAGGRRTVQTSCAARDRTTAASAEGETGSSPTARRSQLESVSRRDGRALAHRARGAGDGVFLCLTPKSETGGRHEKPQGGSYLSLVFSSASRPAGPGRKLKSKRQTERLLVPPRGAAASRAEGAACTMISRYVGSSLCSGTKSPGEEFQVASSRAYAVGEEAASRSGYWKRGELPVFSGATWYLVPQRHASRSPIPAGLGS